MSAVLLVDLNNFARYPTLSIGYIAAILRQAAFKVHVYAPLMAGVRGVARERTPGVLSLPMAKLSYRFAASSDPTIRALRDRASSALQSDIHRQEAKVIEGIQQSIDLHQPKIVLVSTYLMYRTLCEKVGAMCRRAGIPLLVGGPYFSQVGVAKDWLAIPGVSAVTGGEVERQLPSLVRDLIERRDTSHHDGVFTIDAGGRMTGRVARPLAELDSVPFPDFSDFPWHLYPNRIVPVITGRGCGWGACAFCSDISSSSGRTFRSRSMENVLGEVAMHQKTHGTSHFVFTDLKLNSNVSLWRSLCERIQDAAPGAQWVGAVHVGPEQDNGLSRGDLRSAARSGCTRLTTGLESGSQRMMDVMKKGTQVEAIAAFLHDAASAGISCRTTMIVGYPGETDDDVEQSVRFLESNADAIERVTVNRLQVVVGTPLHRQLSSGRSLGGAVEVLAQDMSSATARLRNHTMEQERHRKAVMRLLTAAHRINRRPLSSAARAFEGVM